MNSVNFIKQKTQDLSQSDAADTLHIFTYAQGRFFQFYLNVDLEEAKSRFTRQMNARTPFEMEDEGWDCSITTLGFSKDGESWMGNLGNQFQDLTNALMKQLLQ